jgi:hypothetical protein
VKRLTVLAALAVLLLTALALGAPAQAAPQPPRTATVATLPPLPGFSFDYHGQTWTTGPDGSVQIPRPLSGSDSKLTPRTRSFRLPDGEQAEFQRWYGLANLKGSTGRAIAALSTYRPVTFRFADLDGAAVPRDSLGQVLLKSSTGHLSKLPAGTDTTLLQSTRVVPDSSGLEVKHLYYTVQDVDVEGNNVVNRSQTKFLPQRHRTVLVPLLFFDATVRARDALFGWGISGSLNLEYPNGHSKVLTLGDGGRVALPGLPRGQYHLSVDGPGLKLMQPVAMSRPQDVDLKVFTWLDIAAVAVAGLCVAIGLVLVGRRLHDRRLAQGEQEAVPRSEPQLIGPFLIGATTAAKDEEREQLRYADGAGW